MIKTKDSPRGARKNCINFDQCPLCYGCRNYGIMNDCENCAEDYKLNICKTEIHTDKALSMMLKIKETVKI